MHEYSEKIVHVNNTVFSAGIEGWVGNRIYQVVDFAKYFHEKFQIEGDIAEIGIHHGKLFFIMAAAAAEGKDSCIAVDIFERQHLNLDSSGSGSQEIFEHHMKTLFPDLGRICKVLNIDSMSIPVSMARQTLSPRGLRLFSVDGGHTVNHVVNDLCIAQEAINPGGIIFLDDFFGPHWPSVTEGFFTYMRHFNRRLAPFLIFQNKIFITTFSEHAIMLPELHHYIERTAGDEIHRAWKYSPICGFSVLASY